MGSNCTDHTTNSTNRSSHVAASMRVWSTRGASERNDGEQGRRREDIRRPSPAHDRRSDQDRREQVVDDRDEGVPGPLLQTPAKDQPRPAATARGRAVRRGSSAANATKPATERAVSASSDVGTSAGRNPEPPPGSPHESGNERERRREQHTKPSPTPLALTSRRAK